MGRLWGFRGLGWEGFLLWDYDGKGLAFGGLGWEGFSFWGMRMGRFWRLEDCDGKGLGFRGLGHSCGLGCLHCLKVLGLKAVD